MSYRAGSSGFAFLASWRTGAGNNFCPSVGSSYRAVRSNLPRRMEIARQSRLQLGVARAAAAPWCSSRNLPLNRSAGGLLTGRISLTVRNRIRSKTRTMQPSRDLDPALLAAGFPIQHASQSQTSRPQSRKIDSTPIAARARRKRQRLRSNAPIGSAPARILKCTAPPRAPGHFRLSRSVFAGAIS